MPEIKALQKPLLVEVTRGDRVESRHMVSAVVVRQDGSLVAAFGDVEELIYPRSALKPLQTLPLLLSGAADAFSLTDRQLALASASHNGEEAHIEGVLAWLAALGMTPADLECGAHEPIDPLAAQALAENKGKAGPQHNNCSGKHCGFLTLARFRGVGHKAYIGYDHPVQQEVRAAMSPFLGVDPAAAPWGVDGCGIPNYAVPLQALALGFARIANPAGLDAAYRAAAARIFTAMTRNPYLVGGRKRFDSDIMAAAEGRLIVKGGAEGVSAAAIAESGIGIALKVQDGARRATDIAMAALLKHFAGLNPAAVAALETYGDVAIRNVVGKVVGRVRLGAGAEL